MDNPDVVRRITALEREIDRIKVKETPMFYNGKTITVGTAPYTDIQTAINAWKGATVKNCRISVPSGVYTLTAFLDIQSVWVADHPNDMLFVGDTRAIIGQSWVQGATCNVPGEANGGVGTVTLAGALGGSTITVTCTTTNPSFSAAGIVSGDLILARLNNGTTYELTVVSTSANVITISGTLAAAIGATGTSITLCPNRVIVSGSTGFFLYGTGCNFSFLGFYFKSVSTNAGAMIQISQCAATFNKVVLRINGDLNASQYGFYVEVATLAFMDMTNRAYLTGSYGEVSIVNFGAAKGSTIGILGNTSKIFATNTMFENLHTGFECYIGCYIIGRNVTGVNCDYVAYIGYQSMAELEGSGAQSGVNGFFAVEQSQIYALNTSAKLIGLATKYSPATTNVAGNNNSYISWT